MKFVLCFIAANIIIYFALQVDARANRTEEYARTCALHALRK